MRDDLFLWDHVEPAQRADVIRVAREAVDLFDRVFAHRAEAAAADGTPVQCGGKGCHACCYEVAMAQPWEAAEVFAAFEALPSDVRSVVEGQAERWSSARREIDCMIRSLEDAADGSPAWVARSVAIAWETDTPCAFLVDGACSIYEHRPLACRGHNALTSPASCWERVRDPSAGIASIGMGDALASIWSQLDQMGFPVAPVGDVSQWLALYLQERREAAREGSEPE